MLICLRKVRSYAVTFFLAFSSVVLPADVVRVDIEINNVSSVEDITSRLPHEGQYALTILFADDLQVELRAEILDEVLSSERARDMVGLDLSHNLLWRPPVLTGLVHLQELTLNHNQLTQPPIVTDLVNLQELYLNHNLLEQSPVLTGLVNLQALSLSNNQLTEPPVLTGLVSLQDLFLSDNHLLEPPVLNGLVHLEYIDLSGNQLMESPLLLGLAHLEYIDFSDNQLTEPPLLTDLVHLQLAYFDGNELERPVVIPRALEESLEVIGVPYVIEAQVEAPSAHVVDIATPGTHGAEGVDTVPFFFMQDTINKLPIPKQNPATRRDIVHTMNLVESWRYWRDKGMSAMDFDAKLREPEPVVLEEDAYTVERPVAQAFLRERGLNDAARTAILALFAGDALSVTGLLHEMKHVQSVTADTDASAFCEPKRLKKE